MDDKNYVALNADEVKELQIEILDYVDAFCRENNIHYWLDYGTLLGAVRHKGYIPWDDDIDISMMRGDYERFKQIFNERATTRYRFICSENYPEFRQVFGKVIDTDTVLFEPAVNGTKLAVNIDVFMLDAVPDDTQKAESVYQKQKVYRFLHHVQYNKFSNQLGNVSLLAAKLLHCLLTCFPENYFLHRYEKCMRMFESKSSNYVAAFVSHSSSICEKKVFQDFISVEFEGKKYPSPRDYDKWLKICYGDYMKLPPKEEQVTHHDYIAYRGKKNESTSD